MAASAVLQSLVAGPRPRASHVRHHLLSPPSFLPAQQASRLSVRCMAEDGQEKQPAPVTVPPPSSQIPPPPPPKPKVSTKFTDILAFSGPAPERINGRLAMVGFVAALAVELTKGDDVASQLASGGLWWFVGTSAVLSLASLIPLLQGVTVQSKSEGLMTSDAEMWNGRFAMLGLVALVFTEYLKGGALV